MPLLPLEDAQQPDISEFGVVASNENDKPAPGTLETLGAAYRQENVIGSALARHQPPRKTDENYDPWADIKGTEYEQHFERFADMYSADDGQALKAQIDMETKDREILNASGWVGTATSMLAAVTDPTVFMPGGAVVKTARAGQVGYKVGRTAVSVGAAAAVGTAAQEAALHSTQELRTLSESAVAVGGSVILGGALGATVAKVLSKSEWKQASKLIEADLTDLPIDTREVVTEIVKRAQSGGSAAVEKLTIEDLGIGGPRAAKALANATSAVRLNPGIRLMTSPSAKVREVFGDLNENSVYTQLNMRGESRGAAVESLIKQTERGYVASWIGDRENFFKQARKNGFEGNRSDFNQAVGRAMRRSDEDTTNSYITKAAEAGRAKVIEPLFKAAKEAKLLPEDLQVKTAPSYFSRIWNQNYLTSNEGQFRDIAKDYVRGALVDVQRENPDAIADFLSKQDEDAYLEEVVTSIFNNLTGRGGEGDVPEWIVPISQGPLKGRTFNIQDELIEEFLEDDAELVLRRYGRIVSAEVELTRKFGRSDMQDQIKEIRNEYEDLRKATKEPKKLQELAKREADDIRTIESFRDLVRGTYQKAEQNTTASRMVNMALGWNYMRLLGGVTITSLTDVARFYGVHGFRAVMGEALPSLVTNLKAVKMSAAEAKELGAVTEVALQSRLASLAELDNPYAQGSVPERMMRNATTAFSKATGLGYWNDGMKSVASLLTQNRVLRNIDFSKIDKPEQDYMAFLGIEGDMAQRIGAEFKKHGAKEGKVSIAHTENWTDDAAKRAFAAALNKDVDRTVITKGISDQPLWTRTNSGRLIMQFKSFGLASHQKILIAGLQEQPQRFAEMVLGATAMGMMIAWLKFQERGDTDRAQRLLDNPGLWIADGFDRSGVFSVLMDASNTLEKLGSPVGVKSAAQYIAGDEDKGGSSSRYVNRNAAGALLGPSIGLLQDWATIMQQLGEGDLKKSGANALIRQVPGAALPGVRSGIHMGVKPELYDAIN